MCQSWIASNWQSSFMKIVFLRRQSVDSIQLELNLGRIVKSAALSQHHCSQDA
jgi:hypothetical protein